MFLFISGSATPPVKVTPKLTCLSPIDVVIPVNAISTPAEILPSIFEVVEAKLTIFAVELVFTESV